MKQSIIQESLYHRIEQVGKLVGNTPVFEFRHLSSNSQVRILGKMEWMQLGGSVKARAAYQIIKGAVKDGSLNSSKILLDASSGNTGIAYASIGQKAGIRVTICLPENASRERKEILRNLGADVILTSKFEGTDGAQMVAKELAEKNPSLYFYADQYKNPNNWKAHYQTTAVEILRDLPGITHFVAGLGTTGTFVGTGRRLRESKPDIQLISLQPDSALHGLEGWKHMETAIIPSIYDPTLADRNLEISTEEAYEMIRVVHKKEDLLLSPSSAANVVGALKVANELEQGLVVTMLPDNAEKYSDVMNKIMKDDLH